MQPPPPTILHADVDSFFASVEQRDDPKLRDRPVIVGGGVVMAASYEAKACGIHGGMGGQKARRLCPDAVVVPPRFEAYVKASHTLFEVFEDTAPAVEGLSLEEAFLDVRGLERISGTAPEIARTLRRRVRDDVGLPISVGVAANKLIAKMASRAAKPDGMLVVEPGRELEFLHPIPVEKLWGVGESTAARLHARGLMTVGDIARAPEGGLIALLGRHAGAHLHGVANGRDRRRVRSGRRRRTFGAQRALGRGPHPPAEVEAALAGLVDRVTRRMRTGGRVGRTVILRLRFDDFTRATRSHTLPSSTAATVLILTAARKLLLAAEPLIERRGITLVGVTVANVDWAAEGVQLELPFDGPDRSALDAALDEVHDRFGTGAITRAATLGRNDLRFPHVLDNYK